MTSSWRRWLDASILEKLKAILVLLRKRCPPWEFRASVQTFLVLDTFLSEINVERRHFTRENRLLMHNRKSLVLQERIYFRNIPLSDWIELRAAALARPEVFADLRRLCQLRSADFYDPFVDGHRAWLAYMDSAMTKDETCSVLRAAFTDAGGQL